MRIAACLTLAAALAHGQRLRDLAPPHPGDTVVIGFLGGWERWDDDNRGVRKVVLSLREMPGVHAESLSNHNLSTALRYLNKTKPIRIVIFGQSLGGNATVELARALKARHVPVLLTVQIDSVGLRDAVIPGNVRKAVNYFQHDPLTIWGRSSIRAEDPSQTTILGNFERRYPLFEPVQTSWARRYLGGGHARMEADRALWQEVEDLIRSEIIRR